MKRLFTLFLCLAMLFGLTAAAFAETSGPEWAVDEEGTLTVRGSTGDYTPDEPAPWQEQADVIRRIVVEEGATAIGSYAFADLIAAETAVIPDSVAVIGRAAFASCWALSGISLGTGVEEIGADAFLDCFALEELLLPDGVRQIGARAFANCESLELGLAEGNESFALVDDVLFTRDMSALVACSAKKTGGYIVPAGVVAIAAGAFCGCKRVSHISIPDSVVTIGESAFRECGVTEMTLPKGLTYIAGELFCNAGRLREIGIPTGVTAIGKEAFNGCVALESIRLPGSVAAVKERAFNGCYGLKNVVLPLGLKAVGEYAFYQCTELTEVILLDPQVTIAANAFEGCFVEAVYFAGNEKQLAQWKTGNGVEDEEHMLYEAVFSANFARGDLNGQGGEPDAVDVQCLYTYLTSGERQGSYQNSAAAFHAAADVNNDGCVDVYDLQLLYEIVAKIA